MSEIKKQKAKPTRVFIENPYDLETFFETLSIASVNEKELLYIDRFIAAIRANPESDITSVSYTILNELNLINK